MQEDRNNKGKIYRKWRYSVFVKDDWKCQHCGTEDNLIAHHIIPWDEDVNLRYEISNGLTLCNACHAKHHAPEKTPWNKGKRLPDELRAKISNSNKGKVAWNKGMKMSEEFCKKASEVRIGVKRGSFSDVHRKKIGDANRERLKKASESRKGKSWYKCQETGKRIWFDKE